MRYQEILDFWFSELAPNSWWVKDPQLDATIKRRFAAIHARAARSELWEWRQSADGRLAEIIVLDQFSRNMYRDTPAAFATDPLSLCLSQHAVALGLDQQLDAAARLFLCMPHMHSEAVAIHQIEIFSESDEKIRTMAKSHRQIIERFCRYPHRNATLGRTNTAEEVEFLSQPGSSF